LLDLVAALGLVPVGVPVDADGPLPAALDRALAGGARAVIVTARAHNPTGAAVTADRAADLRAVLAAHPATLLIEDDHAAELSRQPLHPLAGATGAWAFVRSVSKPYGPDLRVAVLAGDEATVARVEGRMRVGTGWVSMLLQRLVVSLWQDGQVAATVAAAGDSYRRRRDGLRQALAARGVVAHGRSGINVWVPVADETRTVAALRDAGYAVAPGALFRLASPPGIRITVSPLDEADLPALADAVAAAVTAHPRPAPPPRRARATGRPLTRPARDRAFGLETWLPAPAQEGEQPGLLVGAGGRLDRRAERAGATQQVAQCLGLGAYVRQVLRRDPFVLAGGPGEVPTVHDQVEVEEPVDRLLERAATGDSVELDGGPLRVLQVVQDDGAGDLPRAGRVVGHVRGGDLFPADQLPE